MTSFGISAPGKVILFGEHAVVYGHTAVAASLDLRTRLQFTEVPPDGAGNDYLYVDMPKIDLSWKIPLRQVVHHFSGKHCPRLDSEGHEAFYNHVRIFLESLETSWTPGQRTSLECLFFSLAQTMQSEKIELKPFRLYVDTSLSIASGSGSSASFSVCLAACFLYWSRLQKQPDVESAFDKNSLEIVSKNAYSCEKIAHGKASGIDNSICTFGSFIEFRDGRVVDNDRFKINGLRILLVDTRAERSTKVQVQKLADLRKEYPEIMNPILESVDKVSRNAIKILHEMENEEDNRQIEFYEKLMILMRMNQGLLSTCQQSHPSLDTICRIAETFGLGAKLTGAGGGGYAYVVLLPTSTNSDVEKLTAELTKQGFLVTKTTLGGKGVEIHKHFHQD